MITAALRFWAAHALRDPRGEEARRGSFEHLGCESIQLHERLSQAVHNGRRQADRLDKSGAVVSEATVSEDCYIFNRVRKSVCACRIAHVAALAAAMFMCSHFDALRVVLRRTSKCCPGRVRGGRQCSKLNASAFLEQDAKACVFNDFL